MSIPGPAQANVLFDIEDLPEISKYAWRTKFSRSGGDTKWYACAFYKAEDGVRRMTYMHSVVIGKKDGLWIDHINRNGLDNRRENLRHVTPAISAVNRRKRGKTSKYRGVVLRKNGRWQASIQTGSKTQYLGNFACEEDAARAVDQAAVKAWGEYAIPNFPTTYSA